MKKLIVLLVLVVAMVAAPLFAEVTEGSWAGDFTYKYGANFKDAAVDAVANDLDLSMSAMVGEFTTFSVGVAGAFAGNGAAGTLALDSIEMTQDFSAMVGNDLTLKLKVGNFNLGVTEYETIGMMDQTDSTAANNLMVTFGTAGVTLNVIAAPTTLDDPQAIVAVEAIYASDMVSGNVAYVKNAVEKGVVEGGVKVVVADLTFAAMAAANLDTEVNSVYAGVQYAMAPVTAKAGFSSADVSAVADNGTAKVGVDFVATEMVTLKAGATIPFADTANAMGVDGAVCMKVDTVEYKLGVAYQNSTYAAAYASANADAKVMVSFQMDVDF